MNQAVVAIGSNIEPERNIPAAIEQLEAVMSVLCESRFLHTEPVGPSGQPEFVNGAVLVETPLDRVGLKSLLRGVESQLGRVRTIDRYAPRPIDLDIVVWNGRIVDDDVRERDFLHAAIREVLPTLQL
ncbi:MAG TPA: 2-amino-4-hydroxy-6-hydroxymethyldihydropteridine diphosphokinase [Phycisphaerales bacterium]|nr:2-amino-4-hydroxy-6-hydroxymethyldihydropteridine diphosphokinase [Phycisphaerales bacterium]